MDIKKVIFWGLIAVSLLSVAGLFIPGFSFPFFFLFFPFMFGGGGLFRGRDQKNREYMRPKPHYCHLCGTRLNPNWKFCPSCSEPVVADTNQEDQSFYEQYR